MSRKLCMPAVEAEIEKWNPSIVIGVGLADNRAMACMERVALNVADFPIPDNEDYMALNETLDEEGPAAYFSTLPIRACVKALRESGIPSRVSNTAGNFAHRHSLPVYMDGARVLNAAVALDMDPAVLCEKVDVVSLCLSKGLACPIGSILMGPKDVIARARVMRQMLGGGWRQGGVVAAAGIVGLNNYKRLAEDHAHAQALAAGLKELGLGIDMAQVQTNVVRIDTAPVGLTAKQFVEKLDGFGVKAKPVGPAYVRMICHNDLKDEMIPVVLKAVQDCLNA